MDAPLTPYPDVNELVVGFAEAVIRELRGNLTGVYLTGSLSYDAFEYHSSDIDFTVMVQRPASRKELSSLRQLHREIERRFPEWSRRLECTYTPVQMLPNLYPPKEGRPWYWGGVRRRVERPRRGGAEVGAWSRVRAER
jgi:predicted nucleotidyltransferase